DDDAGARPLDGELDRHGAAERLAEAHDAGGRRPAPPPPLVPRPHVETDPRLARTAGALPVAAIVVGEEAHAALAERHQHVGAIRDVAAVAGRPQEEARSRRG